MLEQAEHLARRVLADPSLDDAGRVDRTYLAILSRPPTAAERERILRFVASAGGKGPGDAAARKAAAWARVAQTPQALPEFRHLF